MTTFKMTARSELKKYAKLNGYTAEAATTGSFIKHLSLKFAISEYELRLACRKNKIRIHV